MRRIEARRKKARPLRLRFSQSLASLRQRLSHANGALNDPAFGQVNKSFGLPRAFDDLRLDGWQDVSKRLLELASVIAGIGKQRPQEGISANSVASSRMAPSRS